MSARAQKFFRVDSIREMLILCTLIWCDLIYDEIVRVGKMS